MLTAITTFPSLPTRRRRLIDWLFALDAGWRAGHHLREMDDAALADVGMTRTDVEAALRR
jgi:uncharacterized protein YjiS (DUF1127 family)